MLSADIAGLNYGLEYKYEETHNYFCILDCGVCILFYRDGITCSDLYDTWRFVGNGVLGTSIQERW